MASVNRRRLWLGAMFLIVVVVVATAYAFRGRLANAPLFSWLAATDGATGTGTGEGRDTSEAKAAAGGSMNTSAEMAGSHKAAENAGTPRAEIIIDPRRHQLIGVRTVPVERRALTAKYAPSASSAMTRPGSQTST